MKTCVFLMLTVMKARQSIMNESKNIFFFDNTCININIFIGTEGKTPYTQYKIQNTNATIFKL